MLEIPIGGCHCWEGRRTELRIIDYFVHWISLQLRYLQQPQLNAQYGNNSNRRWFQSLAEISHHHSTFTSHLKRDSIYFKPSNCWSLDLIRSAEFDCFFQWDQQNLLEYRRIWLDILCSIDYLGFCVAVHGRILLAQNDARPFLLQEISQTSSLLQKSRALWWSIYSPSGGCWLLLYTMESSCALQYAYFLVFVVYCSHGNYR